MLRSLLCSSDVGLEKLLRVSVLPPFHFGHPALCHVVKWGQNPLMHQSATNLVLKGTSRCTSVRVVRQFTLRPRGSAARMDLLQQTGLHPKSAKAVMFWHRIGKESLGQIEKV